ncbi:MAG: hypothetical protein K0Q73_3784 [Paenibacillus sp.]|nr:hypothetical protein [Paenibacillus sp.]
MLQQMLIEDLLRVDIVDEEDGRRADQNAVEDRISLGIDRYLVSQNLHVFDRRAEADRLFRDERVQPGGLVDVCRSKFRHGKQRHQENDDERESNLLARHRETLLSFRVRDKKCTDETAPLAAKSRMDGLTPPLPVNKALSSSCYLYCSGGHGACIYLFS